MFHLTMSVGMLEITKHSDDNVHDDIIKWKFFFMLLSLHGGNSLVTGVFPSQGLVGAVFFDLRLNKQLNKQSRRLVI